MKTRNLYWASLLTAFGLAAQIWAQPAIPAPPPPPPPAAAAAAAGAAPKNIWSMICLTPEQRKACQERCCQSPLGMLLSGVAGPASMLSGGLIQNKCALPTTADLAKPADSAEGAAAKIKQDEAEAKARRQAVRYLGTVDCHYWPEAEEGLINALRADRNECVRLEAAIVLGRGCCCTAKTINALTLTVTGSDKDGNPSETSERVQAVAANSLAHCTSYFPMAPPESEIQQKEKDQLPPPQKVRVSPKEYYKKIENASKEKLVDEARLALAQTTGAAPASPRAATSTHPEGNGRARGSEGLLGIFAHALTASPKNNGPTPDAWESLSQPAQALTPVPQPIPVPVENQPPITTKPVVGTISAPGDGVIQPSVSPNPTPARRSQDGLLNLLSRSMKPSSTNAPRQGTQPGMEQAPVNPQTAPVPTPGVISIQGSVSEPTSSLVPTQGQAIQDQANLSVAPQSAPVEAPAAAQKAAGPRRAPEGLFNMLARSLRPSPAQQQSSQVQQAPMEQPITTGYGTPIPKFRD
jgi:hypothetical protein